MKKVLIPIADGVEEIEVITPVDILRRGGVQVDLVSVTGNKQITGRNNIQIVTDSLWDVSSRQNYHMLIICGGMANVNTLKSNSDLLNLIKNFSDNQKWIGAICAGPLVLKESGILTGHMATSHPSVSRELLDCIEEISLTDTVTDSHIITSKGAGTAQSFSLKLLTHLQGAEMALKVKTEICAH